MKELYIIAYVDEAGNIISYAKGGGSSTKSYIRAWESLESAQRSQRTITHVDGKKPQILQVSDYEVVE